MSDGITSRETNWATSMTTYYAQRFCTTTCHLSFSTVAIKLGPDRPIHKS